MSNNEVMAAQETVKNSEELVIRFDTLKLSILLSKLNNFFYTSIRVGYLDMFFLYNW